MVLAGFDPNHIAYSWYGKAFVEGTYPHNDKVYYNISINDDWSQVSNGIIDFMLNAPEASTLPTVLLSTTIGSILAELMVEAIIPFIGWVAAIAEILVIIIADVIALIIWSVSRDSVLDEDNNMWAWMGLGFFDFLLSYLGQHASDDWVNPLTWPSHVSAILSGFWSSGYLRVGAITFANNVGILEAIAPQYYGNAVQSTYAWQAGTSFVSNSAGILGQSPNYYYAQLHAGSSNDMAYVVTSLNTAGGGELYVNAYSDSEYSSQMRVYVSSDNSNWYLMPYGERTISSNSAEYYDCGSVAGAYYGNAITYVMVLAWNPGGSPSDLRVDCVQLMNNPQITVRSYGFVFPQFIEFSGVTVYCATSGTTPCTVRGEDGIHTIGVDYYIGSGHLECFFDPYSNTYYNYFAVVSGVAFLTLNMNHDMTLCALYAE